MEPPPYRNFLSRPSLPFSIVSYLPKFSSLSPNPPPPPLFSFSLSPSSHSPPPPSTTLAPPLPIPSLRVLLFSIVPVPEFGRFYSSWISTYGVVPFVPSPSSKATSHCCPIVTLSLRWQPAIQDLISSASRPPVPESLSKPPPT